MPDQRHFSPAWGKSVGGARRRPARGDVVRSNPIARSPRGRDGGRHPGLQERVALRGAPRERRPRPVRLVRSGTPPLRAVAPATVGCPLDAEEGNVVGVREQGVRTRAGRHRPHRASGTRPSLGPGTRAPSCHALARSPSSCPARAARRGRVRGRSSRPRSQGLGRLVRGSRETKERARFVRGQTGRDPGGTTDGTGSSRCCAARRASARSPNAREGSARKGVGVMAPDASESGRRSRPPSTNARTRRAPDQVLVRRGSCRSRQASSGLE